MNTRTATTNTRDENETISENGRDQPANPRCPEVLGRGPWYNTPRAFKFSDTEHLYEFSFRDRLGKTRSYFHPGSDEGPFADEVPVDEIGLPEKGVMNFLFDFGDSWEFELRLESIEPPGKKKAPIKMSEIVGQAPKQYEEDEDFDGLEIPID